MPAVPCAWGSSWGETGGVTGGCGLQACGLFSMGAIGGWGVVAGGCGLQALCPCQQYHAPGGHHGVSQGVWLVGVVSRPVDCFPCQQYHVSGGHQDVWRVGVVNQALWCSCQAEPCASGSSRGCQGVWSACE